MRRVRMYTVPVIFNLLNEILRSPRAKQVCEGGRGEEMASESVELKTCEGGQSEEMAGENVGLKTMKGQ